MNKVYTAYLDLTHVLYSKGINFSRSNKQMVILFDSSLRS